MSGVAVVAGYALRESLRRRVFAVVLVLTALFLALYGFGAAEAFDQAEQFGEAPLGVEPREVTGATIFGLAMFSTLFLGAVLATFLTLGAVRGDAERGLLQPLVVRPLGRPQLLLGRFAGAAAVTAAYVTAVYAAAAGITAAVGGWWPDRVLGPPLELALAATILCGLSLLGSVFLSATANGIAVLMAYGAGLTAGLLGQIGEFLPSPTLERIAEVAAWALPFEALYQDALNGIAADATGFTQFALNLGIFGGANEAGPALWLWALGYLGLAGAAALAGFLRRDL